MDLPDASTRSGPVAHPRLWLKTLALKTILLFGINLPARLTLDKGILKNLATDSCVSPGLTRYSTTPC
jgi:hypothetical protein